MWSKQSQWGVQHQQWVISGRGYIYLKQYPKKVLTIEAGAESTNGGKVCVSDRVGDIGSDDQQWNVTPHGTIELRKAPHKVLTIEHDAHTRDGGRVWLWDKVGPTGNFD